MKKANAAANTLELKNGTQLKQSTQLHLSRKDNTFYRQMIMVALRRSFRTATIIKRQCFFMVFFQTPRAF